MAEPPVTVIPLRCGVLRAPADGFLAGAEGTLDLQVWSFLIQHPVGTVLFDTGMHPVIQDDPAARLGGLAGLFEIHYEPGEEIAERVAEAGVDPAAVDIIVSSHLHFDHAGGNDTIGDVPVVVQRVEWEHARHEDDGGYVPADWDTGQHLELVDGDHDLFNDGRVVCIPTAGHTPGHQSLLVRLDDGDVLLTADACYLGASLEQLALPVFGWDLDRQREVLKRFAHMEASGTTLVFGHDPVLSAAAQGLLAPDR